jgi:hypothetical protein
VEEDLQLALYHLALEESQGISPEALTLYFLRHNLQRTTTRTPQQSAELAKWVIGTGDDISRERSWTPCKGDYCASCDFRAVCPAHTGAPLPPPTRVLEPVNNQLSLLLPEPGPPVVATTASAVSLEEESRRQLTLPLL